MKHAAGIVCCWVLLIIFGWQFTWASSETPKSASPPPIELDDLKPAMEIIGLDFTLAEQDSMLPDLLELLENYQTLRTVTLPNHVPPALLFQPLPAGVQPQSARETPAEVLEPKWSDPGDVKRPQNLADVAFFSVSQLARLIATRQVTSRELTDLYLERLEKYGPQLECVVSLTPEIALAQAELADAEIQAGHYRGPLHGIPYGVKDLFAVKGTKTTWGAVPFQDQVIDETATVVRKLEEAGAVLVAKLTLGALAWGDVWFGGKTRNPWNLEQGSSGSSAGSSAAVAAGLVPFALGTETWGSIVSPCTRVGATGLRPTFGRVSRAGGMALSWSMDKIGPICRTVEDCALVFDVIRGPDGVDQTVIDTPFPYHPDIDVKSLRIGYLKAAFEEDYAGKELDQATLDVLRALGADLFPIQLPDLPVGDLAFILAAEAAAAFDELTRSNRDDLMVRQIRNAWPNVFRTSRLIPAVEYIQANRLRTLLIQEMAQLMAQIDVYVAPSFGGDNLLLTNLTGHPCVVLPNGFTEPNAPKSISFTGRLFDEATLLAVARAYQEATDFHLRHPERY